MSAAVANLPGLRWLLHGVTPRRALLVQHWPNGDASVRMPTDRGWGTQPMKVPAEDLFLDRTAAVVAYRRRRAAATAGQ